MQDLVDIVVLGEFVRIAKEQGMRCDVVLCRDESNELELGPCQYRVGPGVSADELAQTVREAEKAGADVVAQLTQQS
jgi:hypothetical protein|tara:strand:- start:7297 stop:7527 length:231 start_codon:yes stop_codon:yes gene_type:complete